MAKPGTEADFGTQPALPGRPIEQRTVLSATIGQDDFVQFFTQSLDLLCITGLDDGFFKRLNPAWTTILGWNTGDLQGKPFIDFVHPDDRDSTLAEVGKLAHGSEAILFENRYRHMDGSYRWLQWNARPHPSQRRTYAAARDITRRKRYERDILEIIDRERERLGREMHDGLCQTLAGIAAFSTALSRKLAASRSPVPSAHADEISKLLRDAIRDARDMARGLDPIGLDAGGLEGALETLAVNIQHLFPVSCCVAGSYGPATPHRDVEIQLFRIAQEAINNAVAHGRAGRIVIDLSYDDKQGVLSIKDNGAGLPDDTSQSKGMGLYTMACRARLINGSLEVRRREVQGTAVTCTFPLPAQIRESERNGCRKT